MDKTLGKRRRTSFVLPAITDLELFCRFRLLPETVAARRKLPVLGINF